MEREKEGEVGRREENELVNASLRRIMISLRV